MSYYLLSCRTYKRKVRTAKSKVSHTAYILLLCIWLSKMMLSSPIIQILQVFCTNSHSPVVYHLFLFQTNQPVFPGTSLYLPDESPWPRLLSSLIGRSRRDCCSLLSSFALHPYQQACPSGTFVYVWLILQHISYWREGGGGTFPHTIQLWILAYHFLNGACKLKAPLFFLFIFFQLHAFSCTAVSIMQLNILFQRRPHNGLH